MTVALFVEATAKASASERADVDLARTVVSAPVPAKMADPAEGARETDGRAASTAHDLTHAHDADPVAVRGDVTFAAAANAPPRSPSSRSGVESPNSSLQTPEAMEANAFEPIDPDRSTIRATARVDVFPPPRAPRRRSRAPHRAGVPHRPRRARGGGWRRDDSPDSNGTHPHPDGAEAEEARDARTAHGNGTNPAPLVFDEASRAACARCFSATDDEGRLRELCADGPGAAGDVRDGSPSGDDEQQQPVASSTHRRRARDRERVRAELARGGAGRGVPHRRARWTRRRSGRGFRGRRARGNRLRRGRRAQILASRQTQNSGFPSQRGVRQGGERSARRVGDRSPRSRVLARGGAFFSGLVVAFNAKTRQAQMSIRRRRRRGGTPRRRAHRVGRAG